MTKNEKVEAFKRMLELKEDRVLALEKQLSKIEKVLGEDKYMTHKIKLNSIKNIVSEFV